MAAAAAVAGGVLVAAVRRFAVRRALLDVPNERSSHKAPVPRLGGLGIVPLVLVAAGLTAAFSGAVTSPVAAYVAVLVGCGAVVALVSLVDDLRTLPTGMRFLVHFGVAGAAVGLFPPGGLGLELPVIGAALGPWLTAAIVFVWVVGLLNAFNFMDGIDGIAGVQAAVAGVAWGVAGTLLATPVTAAAGWVLAGASVGFLRHNWHPATIFMGDVGSAFIGYLLAVLPLLATAELAGGQAMPEAMSGMLLLGGLAVWPFVADAFYTFLRRAMRRENVFKPHRTHVYQRLVVAGRRPPVVAVAYGAAAAVGALVAHGWLWGGEGGRGVVWLVAAVVVVVVASAALYVWCRRVERRAGVEAAAGA